MTRTLVELRAEARGRGRKGCARCGKPTAGYFGVLIKEPNKSQAGQQIKGQPHIVSQAGKQIIGRNFSFCETHLVELWDEVLAVLEGERAG